MCLTINNKTRKTAMLTTTTLLNNRTPKSLFAVISPLNYLSIKKLLASDIYIYVNLWINYKYFNLCLNIFIANIDYDSLICVLILILI